MHDNNPQNTPRRMLAASLEALLYNKPFTMKSPLSQAVTMLAVGLLLSAWIPVMAAGPAAASKSAAKPAAAKAVSSKSPQPPVNSPYEQAAALVSQANKYAALDQFEQAIPLYEKAVRLMPQEATLKKNLAILYANYGVSLQKDKRYEEAHKQFDRSLALVPGQHEVIEAKAATYYHQAMALRDSQPVDYPRMEQLIDQAIATNPNEKAFHQSKAGLYMEAARDAVAENHLEAAAALLEKSQALDPNNSITRVSRVNLYLKIAQDKLRETPDKEDVAQPWFEKALALDNSPETQDKIKAIKSHPTGLPPGQTLAHAFLQPGNEGRHATAPQMTQPQGNVVAMATQTELLKKLPPSASKLSVVQMLADVEKQLGQSAQNDKSLLERLAAAETQVFGKPQEGGMSLRAKALYASVYGENTPQDHGSKPDLVQEPIQTSDNAYLDSIFKVTEGRVIRWNKFPLRVYIEDGKDNKNFKPEYMQPVLDALETWKTETKGFVTTTVVKNDQAADITITWGEAYTDRFADMEEVPDYYKKYAVPKANPMLRVLSIASMLTPGYFSLAPQALGAALQYHEVKKLQVLIDESKITLGLETVAGLPPEQAKQLLYNMALHEFGHALGLKGHSPQETDVMFPRLSQTQLEKPTMRDVETLRQIYSRPANLVLNIR